MLDYTRKGTYQDTSGYTWVYYGDDSNVNLFYILPQPNYVFVNGNPSIKLVSYDTDKPDTNGAGFVQIEIELTVPANIRNEILVKIPTVFSDATNPRLQALDYNPDAQAVLTVPTESATQQIVAPASEFGSNTAAFTFHVTKTTLDTINALLQKKGGGLDVKYTLSVPAQLPAVTAVLSFNSAIAYDYQVTHAQYHAWSKDTPRSVQKILNQSASSNVDITWGVKNPSAQLKEDVTSWANETLQSLVTAEVNAALKILGMSNYNSFKISDVSSFESTFEENEVIDWFVYPEATIPSLADLGKKLSDFSTTVNSRTQTMTIMANLPFADDSADDPNVPKNDQGSILVDEVIVTVTYPGLSQADATHKFTKNSSHTFTAPYSEVHGPGYDLTCSATFKGQQVTVTGSEKNIEQGTYALKIESVGILNVEFNATQAFEAQPTPTELQIAFSYVNSLGLGTPIQRQVVIPAKTKYGSITSYTGHPINAEYTYTVTYVYESAANFVATPVTSTGPKQLIDGPGGVNPIPVFLAPGASILNATLKLWYEDVTIPGTTVPSQTTPTTFSFDPGTTHFQEDVFLGLISTPNPIHLSTSILTPAGQQKGVTNQLISNALATIAVSAETSYFTLTFDPTAIVWESASFTKVQIKVAMTINGTKTTQNGTELSWGKNDSNKMYLTYHYTPSKSGCDTIKYKWTATYVTEGKTTQPTAQGWGTINDTTVNLPATGTKAS